MIVSIVMKKKSSKKKKKIKNKNQATSPTPPPPPPLNQKQQQQNKNPTTPTQTHTNNNNNWLKEHGAGHKGHKWEMVLFPRMSKAGAPYRHLLQVKMNYEAFYFFYFLRSVKMSLIFWWQGWGFFFIYIYIYIVDRS